MRDRERYSVQAGQCDLIVAVTYDCLSVNTGRGMFRLVYHTGSDFKTCDFECDFATAKEIVTKINNILEMQLSSIRNDYLRQKQSKLSQRHTMLA